MTQPGPSKNFSFSEKIDSDYLFSLYADDYPYIEEVYSITLSHFDDDLETIRQAWSTGNLSDLKRATHKIKPAMGFAGLTGIQKQCMEFEELCQNVQSILPLKETYHQLITTLADSKELIVSEYERLKAYNANTLCP
ncbi:Hpt domain-containing protein [Pseudoflavitalea rhizosphaerae]|uniref:Hpt domain-containing protein n=1 Tax=Pseudoflavitalea rhizosphaerae TaxID=1884793 RepID=UPI000F8E2613|nr:Hpt domain-containing protein [Pseudoflavitalea rhizosphaerae]